MKTTDQEQMKKELIKLLHPTMRVYTVLKHVSRSGMMRHISCYVVDRGQIRCIDEQMAPFLNRRRAISRGMDMGFEIVYSLGRVLFPKGFKCLGDNCQAEDHADDINCNRERGKHLHQDGGYAIKQLWI